MAKILTLSGTVAAPTRKQDGCRCVKNSRTGRGVLLCPVDKSRPENKKFRSGFRFTGPCTPSK